MQKVQSVIDSIPALTIDADGHIQKRLDNLTKPQGSLGRLEELAKRYCSIRGKLENIGRRAIFVMAGDHGVASEGVSAFPQAVTGQMVLNFLNGGAAINVLARHIGAEVIVTDCGVASELPKHPRLKNKKINLGTSSFCKGPAMTREEAVRSLEIGIEVFEESYTQNLDIVATGDMGIANTTPSSAIAAIFTGVPVADVVGRGTGIDDAGLRRKISVIEEGLRVNHPDGRDPVDVLAKVGGFEIGAIAGLCLASAARRVPIVVDGFISTAGALIAAKLQPNIKDYYFAAHKSVEIGHLAMLEQLCAPPILDLKMRLGEGTGAALAINLIEAGVKILTEMATFSNAGVSSKA